MAQHFLLSAKARTLGIGAVTRMSDTQVEETFKAIRWADTDGKPACPWRYAQESAWREDHRRRTMAVRCAA